MRRCCLEFPPDSWPMVALVAALSVDGVRKGKDFWPTSRPNFARKEDGLVSQADGGRSGRCSSAMSLLPRYASDGKPLSGSCAGSVWETSNGKIMKATKIKITMTKITAFLGLLVALVASAGASEGKAPAPLFDDVGNHHHPIKTQSKLAQRDFDQGLTLCFNFNHAEAIRSFTAVATLDPDCAMAWWGVAFAYGPNINMPMMDPAVPKALNASHASPANR